MTQPLFKIGGVYRDKSGDIITLRASPPDEIPQWAEDEAWAFKGDYEYGARSLISGVCPECAEVEEYRLIPGELHQVDGAWVPITEQPMSVYFADAQEGMPVPSDPGQAIHFEMDYIDPLDAAMIARDGHGEGLGKPAVVALPAAPTAHPAIAALTHLGQVDHRFGLGVR